MRARTGGRRSSWSAGTVPTSLLDVRMPGMDGIEATRLICAEPDLRDTWVVVLTTFADDALLAGAIRAGRVWLPAQSMPPQTIRSSARAVADGQTTLAPSLLDRLLKEYADGLLAPSPALERLTDRETDVLREIACRTLQPGDCGDSPGQRRHREDPRGRHPAQAGPPRRTQAAVAAYELGLVWLRGEPGRRRQRTLQGSVNRSTRTDRPPRFALIGRR